MSPLVCAPIGAIIGAMTVAGQAVVGSPEHATSGVILEMLLYGGVAGLLLALPGGVVGGLVLIALGCGWLKGASRLRWVRAGLITGAAVGLAGGLFIVSFGVASDRPDNAVVVIGCTVACVIVGPALGFLGWREFGSTP